MADNKKLIERVLEAQKGNIASRDNIIEDFYPKILRKAKSMGSFMSDDLASQGTIELLKAIEKFDTNKGDNFVSYAWGYIMNGMRSYQGKYSSPVTLPTLVSSDIILYQRAAAKYFNKYGEQPTDLEIKAIIGWGDEKFKYISNIVQGGYGYFENGTIIYKVPDQDGKSQLEKINDKIIAEAIMFYVSNLSEIESKIFRLRYVDKKILEDIAIKLGMSGERVRQIYINVLSKIKMGLGNMR